ncbi:MAG TPA: type II toxin-antitoxin system VapC family toxin [Tepidiformaceae bacterium]|nr:type II toxin-antitoxin system VapC family toxin [Tepidiformaceae bacterium]
MNVYLDTSALVKRYIEEGHSAQTIALIHGATIRATSLLARAEVPAAIAQASRVGTVNRLEGIDATNLFAAHWASYTRIAIGEGLVRSAAGLAWQRALRGYDAVHLAAALLLRSQMDEAVTFATFDRPLWRAARDEGLDAWPPHYGD